MKQKTEITVGQPKEGRLALIEKLRRSISAPTSLLIDQGFTAATWEKIRRRRRRWRIMVLLAVMLGALTGFGAARWIVTPLFEVESRFVIRSGENASGAPGAGGGVLASLGGASLTDGYAVRDYLQSIATFELLESDIGYSALMRSASRPLPSNEGFDLFAENVRVRFNLTEQIVVVRAFADRADAAKQIVDAMIAAAERFADKMNERARQDWLRTTNIEFESYEAKLRGARDKITKWRLDNAQIDPSSSVSNINTNVQQLETQLVQARLLRDRYFSVGRQHPALAPAEMAVTEIERQLRAERERLGKAAALNPIAPALAEFEQLKVEQELAEKNLENGLRIREQAHLQLVKQQKYVVVVSPSYLPRKPAWPQPAVWAFAGAATALLGILGLSALLRT